MIQRIQSLWLLLAAVVILLILKLPYASVEANSVFVPGNYILFLLTVLLSIGALVAIFLFKRRAKQKRLIWLSILVCILFIVLMYFQALEFMGDIKGRFREGALLPVAYIILMAMAYAGVHKDEKLVRSVNRLR